MHLTLPQRLRLKLLLILLRTSVQWVPTEVNFEALGSLDVAQGIKVADASFADASRNVSAGTGAFSGILESDDSTQCY